MNHARILARHDGVFEEHPWEVKLVHVARAFEQIIIERVIQTDPVCESLRTAILEALQREANRAITFLFGAYAAQDDLEGLGG